MKTFAEYMNAVRRTANNPPGTPEPSFGDRLALRGLGLTGEAGEVADLIKKHLFHGKPLDIEKMQKELGDVAWYLAATADLLGLTLEGIAEANNKKLLARFPNGFDKGASQDRADERSKAVYVATKFTNFVEARKAQAALRERGCSITFDWTKHVDEGEPDLVACALADTEGVVRADAVLLIAVASMKGAFTELGMAVAMGVPVHVFAQEPLEVNVFFHHPLVKHHPTLEAAITAIVGGGHG